MENNQILKIYESSLQSKNLINQYQSNIASKDYVTIYAIKKFFTYETDWVLLEQDYITNRNERYYGGNFYKNYHIVISKIPENIISFIRYNVIIKDTPIDVFDSSPKSAFFFISSSDENDKIKTLDMYIPFYLGSHSESRLSEKRQVYSKLLIKIYNPYYFE